MRHATSLIATAVFLAACAVPADQPSALGRVSGPILNSSGVPDVSHLPDLIVHAKTTEQHWGVRVEDLPANFCSVEEGNITPGTHTVLRFTVTTPNIGQGDVFVGSPLAHMDPNGDGDFSDADG